MKKSIALVGFILSASLFGNVAFAQSIMMCQLTAVNSEKNSFDCKEASGKVTVFAIDPRGRTTFMHPGPTGAVMNERFSAPTPENWKAISSVALPNKANCSVTYKVVTQTTYDNAQRPAGSAPVPTVQSLLCR